jgi:ribosomal protein S18 acetylase RimI-like enzyme
MVSNSAQVHSSTDAYAEAMEWALELCGPSNVPRVWIPENAFVEAVREEQSLSLTRRTDNGFFGLGTGENPLILPQWNEFALPQSYTGKVPTEFIERHRWETHACETREQSYSLEILEEDEVVSAFLDTHAPDSSARPGNPEIQFWGCVRNVEGEIASVAAITQWESGEYMLSSVGTHLDMRGKGYAQKVCAGLLGLAYDRGIERVNLVVLSSNTPAINAYKKIGFNEIGKFLSYSR